MPVDENNVFHLHAKPLGGHTVSTSGVQVMSRAELDHPNCPACYRIVHLPTSDYCPRCVESGASERHAANRLAGW